MRLSRCLALLLCVVSGAALAQSYPARPIRLIVPQAPGSASDNIARIVAVQLSQLFGQQVVVDNRPGGALVIGMDLIAKATPDGYTIGYAPVGALAIGPNLVRKVPFNVLTDFQPLAQIASNQMVLAASPSLPLKSVREVIDYAKANPGKLLNASSGNGTPGQVGMEMFKLMSGTRIVHVPYKGGAAAIADLMAGQVHLMMESLNSATPHVRAGRIRPLGVSGPKRSPALPDVPTIAEAGVPGYEATTWNGMVAPVGVPKAVVARLNAEINGALRTQTLRKRFAALGAEPVGGTPEAFGALIRREHAKWGDVIRRSGSKVD
ncbi:MAG: tripartite tricarboxylate transporter substrate binding protein [Betaproteobacteria bacterium]|nr:tripartite tricarboxylate transporter substrate binding protein [Betaproteobacteria bacterium]